MTQETYNKLTQRKQKLEILIKYYQFKQQYWQANELILEYKDILKKINNYNEV